MYFTNAIFFICSYNFLDNNCSWLTQTNEDNVLECGDGTRCNGVKDGWGCFNDYGKRAKCPPNFPIMCAKKSCTVWDDHCCLCCETQCTKRTCGKYIKLGRIKCTR